MTCGCGSAQPGDVQMEHRSAFAMCWTCPARAPRRREPCPVFAELTANGRRFNPTGRTCPRNLWPDKEGRIDWRGLIWMGVPWFLRRRLARERAKLARRQAMSPEFLSGCGCIGILRDTWDAFFGPPSFPPRVIDSRTFNLVRLVIVAAMLTMARPASAQTLTRLGWLLDSPTLVSVDVPETRTGHAPELWFLGERAGVLRSRDEWHPGVVHYSVVFNPRDPLDPPAPFVVCGPRGTVIVLSWLDLSGVRCESRGLLIDARDSNGDLRVNVLDVCDFLNKYVAGEACLYDGEPACDQRDLMAFFAAWGEP